MSLTRRSTGAATACLLLLAASPALAQANNPFGVGISEGGGGTTGLTGWLLAQQGWFQHQLSLGVRATRTDGSAIWWLAGIGFVYGVFHAAGPGHGKAVLASYMVANERALRRGIVLSFLAALLQGAVAIALVAALSLALHATAQGMRETARTVEIVSFAGTACLGAWLVWRKGRAFLALWRTGPLRRGTGLEARFDPLAAAMTPFRASPDNHQRLAFAGPAVATSRFACLDVDAHNAIDCPHCHGPDPATLGSATFSWREAGLTVLAAGARPCSGAILVLVFALAQGVFSAGIASVLAMSVGVAITTGALASVAVLAKGTARRLVQPGSRSSVLLMSGLELLAAAFVLLAGSALLLGYMVLA